MKRKQGSQEEKEPEKRQQKISFLYHFFLFICSLFTFLFLLSPHYSHLFPLSLAHTSLISVGPCSGGYRIFRRNTLNPTCVGDLVEQSFCLYPCTLTSFDTADSLISSLLSNLNRNVGSTVYPGIFLLSFNFFLFFSLPLC